MILIKIKLHQFLRILKYDGGEGGIEPTNELPRCWFSRPVLSTAQPPLLILVDIRKIYINCISFQKLVNI